MGITPELASKAHTSMGAIKDSSIVADYTLLPTSTRGHVEKWAGGKLGLRSYDVAAKTANGAKTAVAVDGAITV